MNEIKKMDEINNTNNFNFLQLNIINLIESKPLFIIH